LYLKFVLGPKMGLLHGSSGHPTADIDSTVAQVIRALNEVGLHPDRSAMRLRLRSFGKDFLLQMAFSATVAARLACCYTGRPL